MWASLPRPCSSQADGQVWKECICWQEFDGARGTNGSHVLTRPLSALGKKTMVEGATLQGEGCRTSYLSFYKLLLVNGFQQWHLTRWAQKPGKWWRQSNQWEARETFTTSQQQACPGYILPKKGISQPTLLVRHSSILIVMLGVPFASVSSQKAFQGKQVAKTGIKRTS